MFNYTERSDVPVDTRDYILTVSGASDFSEVVLTDVNDYLNGLDDWAEHDMTMRRIDG